MGENAQEEDGFEVQMKQIETIEIEEQNKELRRKKQKTAVDEGCKCYDFT